jgi:Pyruvate/2-oxoacid:ferredoxin oxidoreductase delta subunit
LGLQYIVDMGEMQEIAKAQSGKVKSSVDYGKCVGPDKCKICLDNWCVAIYKEDGQIKVDSPYCAGCGICVMRCPNKAFSLSFKR